MAPQDPPVDLSLTDPAWDERFFVEAELHYYTQQTIDESGENGDFDNVFNDLSITKAEIPFTMTRLLLAIEELLDEEEGIEIITNAIAEELLEESRELPKEDLRGLPQDFGWTKHIYIYEDDILERILQLNAWRIVEPVDATGSYEERHWKLTPAGERKLSSLQ